MDLYRVNQRWSNGSITLVPGAVHELTAEEVRQVGQDCPAGLTALTPQEVAAVEQTLADLGLTNASFRPPTVDASTIGRGAGEVAMNSASMTGLTRP